MTRNRKYVLAVEFLEVKINTSSVAGDVPIPVGPVSPIILQPKPITPPGMGNPATTVPKPLPPTAPPYPVGDYPTTDPYGPVIA